MGKRLQPAQFRNLYGGLQLRNYGGLWQLMAVASGSNYEAVVLRRYCTSEQWDLLKCGICDFVCLSVRVCVRALKGKWLELSTPNLLDIQCMEVSWHSLTLKSKGQGYAVIKCAATASVGMQVDMTVWFLVMRGLMQTAFLM